MKDVDDHIRDALLADQDEFFDEDEDWQAHSESLKTMFRGKTKWFTILHLTIMGVFLTMIVICGIQFFRVESTRAMIGWATGFLMFLIMQGSSEIYFLMEWNKYVTRRELKRIELQIASLAQAAQTESEQPATGE